MPLYAVVCRCMPLYAVVCRCFRLSHFFYTHEMVPCPDWYHVYDQDALKSIKYVMYGLLGNDVDKALAATCHWLSLMCNALTEFRSGDDDVGLRSASKDMLSKVCRCCMPFYAVLCRCFRLCQVIWSHDLSCSWKFYFARLVWTLIF